MTKIVRHFARKKAIDDAKLKRMWLSPMPECEIAKRLGHARWALRRRAIKLGLPSSRKEIWKERRTDDG